MSTTSTQGEFCARCGTPSAEGDHSVCARWLAAEEPPRFCVRCARRMKVQVTPVRWTAVCVEHGQLTGGQPTA